MSSFLWRVRVGRPWSRLGFTNQTPLTPGRWYGPSPCPLSSVGSGGTLRQTHKRTVKLPVLHTGQKRARNPGKHQCGFAASQVNHNLSKIICGLQRILNFRIADRRLWTCLLIDLLSYRLDSELLGSRHLPQHLVQQKMPGRYWMSEWYYLINPGSEDQ